MLKFSFRSSLTLAVLIGTVLPLTTEAGGCRNSSAVRYAPMQYAAPVHTVSYIPVQHVSYTVMAAAPAVQLAPALATQAPSDIVDTAVAAKFTTLVAAVKAAGLAETLKGKGPFTVFAPTDDAFAKLPKETLESLLKPENKEKLAAILTYHVVSGKVMAADVVKLTEAKTVNGKSVKIKVTDGVVTVDGAKVTKTDVNCANGVIHIIDTVIIPK